MKRIEPNPERPDSAGAMVWGYRQPMRMRMIMAPIFDPDKDHCRPYVFDTSTEWDERKDKAWRNYWDRSYWDELLTRYSQEGFSAMCWMHSRGSYPEWQAWALRFEEFPEARQYGPEVTDKAIEHLSWIFGRTRELGMANYLYTCLIHYSQAFAVAHGLGKDMGVRNELTRAYTEAAVAEVFQLYPDLDGLVMDIGEALPGERSSFFQEAIVPGLKRCGRKPHMIVMNWQIPIDSYIENVAPREVYDNTWIYFHSYNMEVITDKKPYPYAVEWAERVGLPIIYGYMPSNSKIFPFNSPRFAYQMTVETKKVENAMGFLYWPTRVRDIPPGNYLFREALASYGASSDPYSEEPWIDRLEERYGDREAARHFLKAYEVSSEIVPETQALVWFSGDIAGLELRLPYRYFIDSFPFNGFTRLNKTSPARGIYLVSVEDYVRIVAEKPESHGDRDGSETTGHQSHIWDYGTFDVTPPAQMRKVRQMGEDAWREAQLALRTVRENRPEAEREARFIKALMLMSRYYEKKVLAAISAWLYAKAGRVDDRADAERLADEALASYLEAANFMLDELNDDVLALTGHGIGSGGWLYQELPGHIEGETKDREEMPATFGWAT